MPRKGFIHFRGGTAAEWASENPILGEREPGYETDTGLLKVGDDVTHWNDLGYTTAGGAPPTGAAGGDLAGSYPNPDVETVDDDVLGSGTPDTTTFLRGDRTWAVPAGTGGGSFSLLTDGDTEEPELVFADADVIVVET